MATKTVAPAKKAPRAPSASKSQKRGSSAAAERRVHNPEAAGSTPAPAPSHAGVAQSVEPGSSKPTVAGSSPAPRSTTPPGSASTPPGPLEALPPIEQRFVLEYIKDFNATRAYLRVKPHVKETTAATEAGKLLGKPEIQAALQAASARLVEKMELTSERTLREIARLAYFDPRKLLDSQGRPKPLHELDDDTAAAIAGLEVQQIELGSGENALPAVVKKYKLADKKGALDMAMRHLGEYEKHNKQLTDPLKALLDGMQRSTLPVSATPPEDAP